MQCVSNMQCIKQVYTAHVMLVGSDYIWESDILVGVCESLLPKLHFIESMSR